MIKFLQILLPSVFTNWFTPSLSGVASAVGIASGVSSLFGDSGGGNTAGGGYYDPYASERPQYFAKLKELTGMGPEGTKGAINTVLNAPGYVGGLQQGERTLGRNLAARGLTESGAENLAYKGYGQDYFNQQYQNLYNMFTGLSGATNAPLNMSNINALNASQNQAGWGAIAQGVGGLGKAASSFDTANATWLPTAFQDTSQPFTANWGNL
jgi:hypothetical protein